MVRQWGRSPLRYDSEVVRESYDANSCVVGHVALSSDESCGQRHQWECLCKAPLAARDRD